MAAVAAIELKVAPHEPPTNQQQHYQCSPTLLHCIKSCTIYPAAHLRAKPIVLVLVLYILFALCLPPYRRILHLPAVLTRAHDHLHTSTPSKVSTTPFEPTNLQHIVFCIASTAKMWGSRQNYTKLWWKPPPGGAKRRGFVWLDRSFPATAPNSSSTTNDTFLPLVKISSDASRFPYRVKGGNPSAVRISRIISDTFRLGLKDVRWFVMGDDDTIFFPENLATVLQKYDHGKFYYIGQSTESQQQAILHSFGMAYGGGGIALSYPLAEAMANMQDDCLQRYPNIYGSDGRIAACAAELGVPLTREPGFHQIDLNKNIRGILAAHPVAPLVSLHHLDRIQPIFPDRDRLQALQHLYDGALPDQEGLLQQSICFDTHRGLTFSVSWGYVVQVFDGILTTLEVQKPIATFQDWVKARQGRNIEGFTMDVRANPTDPCQNPAVFFMESVGYTAGGVRGVYRRKTGRPDEPSECPPLIEQDTVEVFKQPQSKSWIAAPRRQCCEVVEKKLLFLKSHAYLIDVRDCMRNEVIAPHN